tara:strand:- start:426 stop:1121 length:696 start_codon:yes stop_codon:yes gene_type:complete
MMKSSYKDRELPEAFKKNMKKKADKEARYGSAKDCPKCKGDKKKCPGGKACPMTAKKDMGRSGPYADGSCMSRDDIAAEFNAVMINDAEREDKPCGNSYIPQNAKCHHGSIRGRAGQGAKLGSKIGAGVGALQGAALGSIAGPGGALMGAAGGAVGGAIGGAMQGGFIGGVVGAAEKSGSRNKRYQASSKKIKERYKKAYHSGKAKGLSRKKMQELDQKYAMQFARAADRR